MAEEVETTTVELAANDSGTRAHYSKDLAPRVRSRVGRRGTALCSTYANSVDVYDQEATADAMPPGWRKPRVVAEMPLCKKCTRIAERDGLGAV